MNLASFESIILNLISNSIRALLKVSRTQKRLKVSIEKTSNNLKIRVFDNGFGIDEENYQRVFDPFWTTYKGEHEYGTGMGLTIVKEIVEEGYDGTVEIEKSTFEKNDQGNGETTVLLTIPLEKLEKNE